MLPTVGQAATVAILTVGGTYRFVMPTFVPQIAKLMVKMAVIVSKELVNVSNKFSRKMNPIRLKNMMK